MTPVRESDGRALSNGSTTRSSRATEEVVNLSVRSARVYVVGFVGVPGKLVCSVGANLKTILFVRNDSV